MPGLSTSELADRVRAEIADLLDLQLAPLGLAGIDALGPRAGDVVLDVGCGAGQSTLQLAERVGPSGRAIGVDIAPQVLAVARRRAGGCPHAQFLERDVTTLALPDASLDGVFSRFGVMAIADPTAAFRNLRRMLKPTGRLALVTWRSLAENALDHFPLQAAGLTADHDATPFSFADPTYVHALLETAGFRDISLRAHDQTVSSGSLEAMTTVLLSVGALGKIVRENPALKATVEPRLRAALAARGSAGLTAATWVISARA